MRQTTRDTVAKARLLRRTMTPPEASLWQILRTKPGGFKFRRQHPVGPYVLDFYCPIAKLAIEVDGIAHEMGDNPSRDEGRDRWFNENGYRVLRIPAAELRMNIESVLRHILTACAV